MPELDPVSQEFTASNADYLAALQAMIDQSEKLAAATLAASDAMASMGLTADDAGLMMGAAANRANDLATAAAKAGAAGQAAAAGLGDARTAAAELAAASTAAAASMGVVDGAAASTAVSTGLLGRSFLGTALTWGQALHWIVMGTLELASTAIPAMVAFGSAAVAMYPTFDQFFDKGNELITAAGGIHSALADMGGPLSGLASEMQSVDNAVAPDVWIILGSAIEVVTGHMGTFSGIAKQASDVLADFTTKIVDDLQGPAGTALDGFFSSAVKDMVQWGQFLGNMGHTFLNVINSMWGVGKILLDVLDGISEALLAISSTPVIGVLIGLAAAMSAAYRYGLLMKSVFTWLGGTTLVETVTGLGSAFVSMASDLGIAAAASQLMEDALAGLTSLALGPVGIAIGAAAIVTGLWYASSHQAADATTELIKTVEGAPDTINNLMNGIQSLTLAMGPAVKAQSELSTGWRGGAVIAAYGTGDVNDLTKAVAGQLGKLNALVTTVRSWQLSNSEAAASLSVLSIQTSLADTKVTALNQAWDQYISMVTGGTGGLAAFGTALQNVTSVSSGAGTNLATTALTLGQFQQAMAQGPLGTTGSSAWTNFDSLLNTAETQVADWGQTALTAGALTKGQFAESIVAAAQELIPFAQGNATATAEVLAFANRSGTLYANLNQLGGAYGGTGAAASELTGILNAGTTAMSNASQIAQNLSSVLGTQETQAIAAAALKASGFTTDVNNMVQAEQTHSTVGGHTWQQWAQMAQTALTNAQNTATGVMTNIGNALAHPLPAFTVKVNFIAEGSQIAMEAYSASGGLTSQAVYAKTSTGIVGHGASGGMIGGYGTATSDSNLIRASRGEYIVNAAATAAYRPLLDAVNAKRYASGGVVGSPGLVPQVLAASLTGGGGDVHLNHASQVNVNIGTRRFMSEIRRNQLTFERRNSASGMSLGRQGTPR